MSHIQFNRDTRVELAILLSAKKTQGACARILGMNRSNVCLEINRNKDPDGIYRGGHADKRYIERRKRGKMKEKKIENDQKLQRYIVCKLKLLWSPEQISGRLKYMKGMQIVCHETIYSWLYRIRPDLVKYLRHEKSKYRKKRGSRARMKLCKAMKVRSIKERPVSVLVKKYFGDWEDDTLVGKEKVQRIWSCVERKSGYGLGEKVAVVTAENMYEVVVRNFQKIPRSLKVSLTRDNGVEFGDYDSTLEKKTGLLVYRAHAYKSNDRPCNENWNGLMRQFFPKGSYFASITTYQVDRAVRMLNDRPRKRLGYRTPREVFRGCCDSD